MPALAHAATATALALSLTGGAMAFAQSTAVQGHTTYVELVVRVQGPADDPVLQGAIGCDAPLHQELFRRYMGRPVCKHDGYAYVFPKGQIAPWDGRVLEVDDTTHTTGDGRMLHVAEIVYEATTGAPGEASTLRAIASELRPIDRSEPLTGAHYELPLRGEVLPARAEDLDVSIGPAPVHPGVA